ncbi:hypothetical protein [Polaribacter ponticola]|uniref:Uncharacterized protein n=1 Tax=Polaribacter ponticola TaxID=2978475 RepID=A0ABT5S987_9FLAO|nr:hypothetical protein [Polaribacter sp. MSW5]MDD7914663.1 hypothetical protein [Polaribacter sp. MSW5]
MKKSTENNSKQSFLKEGLKGDISKHHKKYLGTDIPEGYFVKSKMSILDKIKEEQVTEEVISKKGNIIWMQPQFKYIAAASLVFILSLTVWLQSSSNYNSLETNTIESFVFSDDVLINSLLIEESEIDAFEDATLFNEVLVKAELSEQKLDNLILNSLFVEDTLLDDYINEGMIETIIL